MDIIKTNLVAWANGIFFVSAAILTIGQTKLRWNEKFKYSLDFSGIVGFAAAGTLYLIANSLGVLSVKWATIALVAVAIVAAISAFFIHKGKRYRTSFPQNWKFRAATLADLTNIVELGKRKIGDAHPTAEQLKPFLAINQNIIWLITKKNTNEIIAYFWIFPLGKEATEKIWGSQIINAKGLKPTHILSRFGNEKSLYLAMITGKNGLSKGWILRRFNEKVAELVGRNRKLQFLFARKATQDGERLMKPYDFVLLKSPSEIYYVECERAKLKHARRKQSTHKYE